MESVIIYDKNGNIWFVGSGCEIPESIAVMSISIPDNSYLECIDMSKEPPEPIFKERPKSKLEMIEDENIKQQADIDYLMILNDSATVLV